MGIITTPIQWEITESQNRKKERAYLVSKASGLIFILIFILFSSLGFLLMGVIIFVIIYFIKKDDILKSSKNLSSSASSKYKISESGIEVFVTDKKQSTCHLWENMLSFYAFSRTGPVGYFSSSVLGDDFVIIDKQKNQILLKTNKINSPKVKMALLKKIKKKIPTQNENMFFSITSKNLTLTKHDNLNSITAPVAPQFKNKTPQEKNIAEKNFYEQQRQYKQGIQKQKDSLNRNILFFIYILSMFLVTIIYFIKN
ncbi:MAG: hypothetical protein KAI57_04610 [Candidatus Pacebacteria bacterium]|nr:hypothetical protein [Candidatus Paceibacterota bacterium]